jgi:putative addiction module killer protein
MGYEITSTEPFEKWLKGMKDRSTKNKVLSRLARIENGNFGDYKQLSSSLFELRFFFGGGIRIYYTIRNNQVVLLLVGGDKSSQSKDIEKANQIIEELE